MWVNIGSGNACCLTTSSRYLNQCWLIISEVQWHSSQGNFIPPQLSINKLNLKMMYVKFNSIIPRANELKSIAISCNLPLFFRVVSMGRQWFIILRAKQNGYHLADNIHKNNFLEWKFLGFVVWIQALLVNVYCLSYNFEYSLSYLIRSKWW